jgi:hypothetical protein
VRALHKFFLLKVGWAKRRHVIGYCRVVGRYASLGVSRLPGRLQAQTLAADLSDEHVCNPHLPD